jgi:TetR/AcrR family transcriptional repressor of nem operon
MSKGELTRQRILEKAAPLFNKRGFRTAPMSEIMEATGMQKGGIYNHFRSKEQLALEAFDYAAGLSRARFALADQEPSGLRALKGMIERTREYRKNPALAGGCPLLNSAVESDDAFPELRERVSRVMRDWHLQIQKQVLKGKKNGEFSSKIDPGVVATVIIACLEGGILLGRLQQDEDHMNRCYDHLLAYIDSLVTP